MQLDLIFHGSILVHLCFIVIIPLFLHYCLRSLLNDQQCSSWHSFSCSVSKFLMRHTSCQEVKANNESIGLPVNKKQRKGRKNGQSGLKSLQMTNIFIPNKYSFNVTQYIQINPEINDRTLSNNKSSCKIRECVKKANRSRKSQFLSIPGLEIINEELQEQINL